jgi:hypothetical protein
LFATNQQERCGRTKGAGRSGTAPVCTSVRVVWFRLT